MEGILELDVLIYPDEVRLATPEDIREWELETASQLSVPSPRLFVALYPYNPAAMSPNQETAAEELPFVPGQLIKVFGDKDSDGFYHGESGGLWGDVPSNMVAEVPVEDGREFGPLSTRMKIFTDIETTPTSESYRGEEEEVARGA
ncbi:hypothetical protein CRUP_013027, partial [Coryphaenoides rupestris]